MTSDVMHSNNYGHLGQICFPPSSKHKKQNESSRFLLNARIYPNGLRRLAFGTPSYVSSDSILTCQNVAARKVADEYRSYAIRSYAIRSYAIIHGFAPWNEKQLSELRCFAFCSVHSAFVAALIYEFISCLIFSYLQMQMQ
jgi:hypothetical protein